MTSITLQTECGTPESRTQCLDIPQERPVEPYKPGKPGQMRVDCRICGNFTPVKFLKDGKCKSCGSLVEATHLHNETCIFCCAPVLGGR